jgi:cyclophilin family peptidyl-prolyl cis-trans isomerase
VIYGRWRRGTSTRASKREGFSESVELQLEEEEELKLIHRRGLVGMANSGKRNTNTSQFFFTLDKADELTNKHTMFGKVVGNTIYSMSLFLGVTKNGWR